MYLKNNQIGDLGAGELITSKYLTRLYTLDLTGNDLSAETIALAKATLKDRVLDLKIDDAESDLTE
jgi:hypothetical protein